MSPFVANLISELHEESARLREPNHRQRSAAVAVLVHDDAVGPQVLLMQRAIRADDPWSGHISLPGGGYEFTTTTAVEPMCGPEATTAFWLPIEIAATRDERRLRGHGQPEA